MHYTTPQNRMSFSSISVLKAQLEHPAAECKVSTAWACTGQSTKKLPSFSKPYLTNKNSEIKRPFQDDIKTCRLLFYNLVHEKKKFSPLGFFEENFFKEPSSKKLQWGEWKFRTSENVILWCKSTETKNKFDPARSWAQKDSDGWPQKQPRSESATIGIHIQGYVDRHPSKVWLFLSKTIQTQKIHGITTHGVSITGFNGSIRLFPSENLAAEATHFLCRQQHYKQ